MFVSTILNPQKFINYSKSSDESNFRNFDVFILFHTLVLEIGGYREGFSSGFLTQQQSGPDLRIPNEDKIKKFQLQMNNFVSGFPFMDFPSAAIK